MNRPGWLIGGAVVAAVAILALAWAFGGDAPASQHDDRPAPQVRPPGELLTRNDDPDASPLQSVERARFRSVGDDRVTILSFDALEPRADYLSDFTNPRAEVYFDDGRLLVIEGPAATIYHPANDPQRGSFDRDVIVTVYEGVTEGQADPPTDADVAVRIYLDAQTNFDRDIGRIVTDGPVFLTGPESEFTGQGLELTYNTAGERIESMTIARGESLRLQRPADDAGTEAGVLANDADTVADQTTVTEASADAGPPDEVADVAVPVTEAPTNIDTAADPPQFYRAVFANNVDVHVGPDEADMAGDALHVVFALEREASHRDAAGDLSGAAGAIDPSDRRLAYAGGAAADAAAVVTDADAALVTPPTRSLMPVRDDDITVTWTGQLRLQPLDETPDTIRQADDAMLALYGSSASPATLRRTSEPIQPPGSADEIGSEANDADAGIQTVAADELRYFTSSRRIEALGSVARPLIIDDPGQGRLTGIRFTLDPDSATGRVLGPGRLVALNPDADIAGATESRGETDAPPALDLTFATHLDLEFETQGGTGNSDNAVLGPLRRAIFQGDVHARAYDDELLADARATASDADNTDHSMPALDVTAETMIIDLDTDDAGRTQPTALTARRGVLARQPGRSIQADSLRAELSPQDEDPSDTLQTPEDPRIQLSALKATGHVTVRSDADDATLTGHRLVAFPDTGRLTLTGTDDTPARVRTADADLLAPSLDFDDATQTLLATGAGSLTTKQAGADELAGDDAAKEPAGDTTLHIAWRTHLHYHGTAGEATALGDVRATTTSPTESARLDAHQLDLTFAPGPGSEPGSDHGDDSPSAVPDEPAPLPNVGTGETLALDLRTVHATPDPATAGGTVTFSAQTPDPRDPKEPATRLTLVGPDLFFENDPVNTDAQRVVVDGAGQMLLEDYRPPTPPEDEQTADDAESEPGLQLAGRGVTFFQWTDDLRVNLHTNDLTMTGDVRMNHDPQNDQPRIRLFGDRLTADLTETQPLAAMLAPSDAPSPLPGGDPELRRVQLDGRVRVAQETRNVFADQLIYEAASRNVLLQAAPGRDVRVHDPQRGNLDAAAITWNLDDDRIRITEYRGGVMPVE